MTRPLVALLAVLLWVCSGSGPVHASNSRATHCWGRLTVAPSRVALGGAFVLQGNHYACTGPAGFLPKATVMFYQPNYGFAMFTVRPHRNGTYRRTITVPRRLRAMSDINGGGNRSVRTRPGRYYIWITLFDVSVVPPSQAVASILVT